MLKILVLEPYYGGSHRAFIEGWSVHSRHKFVVLNLPAYHWKWRMRHAAVTFSERLRCEPSHECDAIFCSDMLNLAEFRGLVGQPWVSLPAIVYFHENQFTYPVREEHERDLHFAMTNVTTALAADQVWFNSEFHRRDFLTHARELLGRMPDFQPLPGIDAIERKSFIHPPGIEAFPQRGVRRSGPMRIVWAARWEHDKAPEEFFAALAQLRARGVDFRVSVLGESFADVPDAFGHARRTLADHIDHWGFLASRAQYRAALTDADVFVSTARHEFFGIAAVEAIAAGAFPLLPARLAYPELLPAEDAAESPFFYGQDADQLAIRLADAARRLERDELWPGECQRALRQAARFHLSQVADTMDAALENTVGQANVASSTSV